MDSIDLHPLDAAAGRTLPTRPEPELLPADDGEAKRLAAEFDAVRRGEERIDDALVRVHEQETDAFVLGLREQADEARRSIHRRIRENGLVALEEVRAEEASLAGMADAAEAYRQASWLRLVYAYGLAPTHEDGVLALVEAVVKERYDLRDALIKEHAVVVANLILSEAGVPTIDALADDAPLADPADFARRFEGDAASGAKYDGDGTGEPLRPPGATTRSRAARMSEWQEPRPAPRAMAALESVRRATARPAGGDLRGWIFRARSAVAAACPGADSTNESVVSAVANLAAMAIAGQTLKAAGGGFALGKQVLALLLPFLIFPGLILLVLLTTFAMVPVLSNLTTASVQAANLMTSAGSNVQTTLRALEQRGGMTVEMAELLRLPSAAEMRAEFRRRPELLVMAHSAFFQNCQADLRWIETTSSLWQSSLRSKVEDFYSVFPGGCNAGVTGTVLNAVGRALSRAEAMGLRYENQEAFDRQTELILEDPIKARGAMGLAPPEFINMAIRYGTSLRDLLNAASGKLRDTRQQSLDLRLILKEISGVDFYELDGLRSLDAYSYLSSGARMVTAFGLATIGDAMAIIMAIVGSGLVGAGRAFYGRWLRQTVSAPVRASVGGADRPPAGLQATVAALPVDEVLAGMQWILTLGMARTAIGVTAQYLAYFSNPLTLPVSVAGGVVGAAVALCYYPVIANGVAMNGARPIVRAAFLTPFKTAPTVYLAFALSSMATLGVLNMGLAQILPADWILSLGYQSSELAELARQLDAEFAQAALVYGPDGGARLEGLLNRATALLPGGQ